MKTHPVPAARYRDADGTVHDLVVRRSPQGAWEILDTSPAHTQLVDSLSGFDDGRPQAEAIARDYASQQQRPRQPGDSDELGFAA
jgi:hypothetical protein